MIKFFAYTGSALMVVFSFTGYLPLAVFGLACLTVQCVSLGAFNLVAINLISIVGFMAQMLKQF